MSVESATTVVSNVVSILVNLWVLYQVRLLIGKELSKGASKAEDALKRLVD